MFKGQPKKPLFKVGDTVHAILQPEEKVTTQQTAISPKQTAAKPQATNSITPTPIPTDSGIHLPPNIFLRVTSIRESTTDETPHTYTVAPVYPLSFNLTEPNLLAASFPPGSFVIKKNDLAKELAVVQGVNIAVRDGVDGKREYVLMLNVCGEMGPVEVVEAGKVRMASEEEASEWFPMGG